MKFLTFIVSLNWMFFIISFVFLELTQAWKEPNKVYAISNTNDEVCNKVFIGTNLRPFLCMAEPQSIFQNIIAQSKLYSISCCYKQQFNYSTFLVGKKKKALWKLLVLGLWRHSRTWPCSDSWQNHQLEMT